MAAGCRWFKASVQRSIHYTPRVHIHLTTQGAKCMQKFTAADRIWSNTGEYVTEGCLHGHKLLLTHVQVYCTRARQMLAVKLHMARGDARARVCCKHPSPAFALVRDDRPSRCCPRPPWGCQISGKEQQEDDAVEAVTRHAGEVENVVQIGEGNCNVLVRNSQPLLYTAAKCIYYQFRKLFYMLS